MLRSALILLVAIIQAVDQPAAPPLAPETAQALQLQRRAHVEPLTGDHLVYLHSVSEHLFVEEYAHVAARRSDGTWVVSRVGEERSGSLATSARIFPESRRVLSERQGRRLSGLLRRASLFTQVDVYEREVPVGAYLHTIEIVTPEARTVIRWSGRMPGVAGEVADLIMRQSD